MFKKIVLAVVLVAFVAVQLANTLNCYECKNPRNCATLTRRFCDENAGNDTNNILNQYFSVPVNRTSQNFDCLFANYTEGNNTVLEVRGCVYREMAACSLTINPSVGATWIKRNCTTCSGDYCNERSPAGTFSSSFYILLATTLLALIAKVSVF